MTWQPFLGQVPLVQAPQRSPFLASRYRMGAGAVAVTDANFQQVLAAPKAIVDFWSPTCPYCTAFKPIFEDVASSSLGNGISMYTADIDDAGQSFAGYKATMLPTVIFLVNGKEVHRAEGGMSKDDFLTEMSQAFGGGAPSTPASPANPQVRATPSSPTMVVPASSGSSATWMGLGGLAAAGLMGWLILKQ